MDLDDRHAEVQALLPWYTTDRLDAGDHARVQEHLFACAECRAMLGGERRLAREVAAMPLDVELGWAAMRARMAGAPDAAPLSRRRFGLRPFQRREGAGRRSAGWAVAAAASLLAAVLAFTPRERPAAYHALGAAPSVPAVGNAIVMFRPDLPAGRIGAMLGASGARIVDGPTATGGFVLHVAPAGRAGALAALRRQAGVSMAEPIDL